MTGDKLVKIPTEDGNFYLASVGKDAPWASVQQAVKEADFTPHLTQNWFAKLMRKLRRERVIYRSDNNLPYMYRYYLWRKPTEHTTGIPKKEPRFNVFIHNIVQSDIGDPHDHPWDYTSVILWGGYVEWIYIKTPVWETNPNESRFNGLKLTYKVARTIKYRRVGDIIKAHAERTHMVHLKDKPAWTLFIRGPKVREWGFLNPITGIWEQYQSYLNKRFAADRRSI